MHRREFLKTAVVAGAAVITFGGAETAFTQNREGSRTEHIARLLEGVHSSMNDVVRSLLQSVFSETPLVPSFVLQAATSSEFSNGILTLLREASMGDIVIISLPYTAGNVNVQPIIAIYAGYFSADQQRQISSALSQWRPYALQSVVDLSYFDQGNSLTTTISQVVDPLRSDLTAAKLEVDWLTASGEDVTDLTPISIDDQRFYLGMNTISFSASPRQVGMSTVLESGVSALVGGVRITETDGQILMVPLSDRNQTLRFDAASEEN